MRKQENYSKRREFGNKRRFDRRDYRENETTNKKDTSWQSVAKWYNKLVGEEGQYFHQKVIIPKAIELLDINESSSLLDLACGQGILSRHIPSQTEYQGVDLSSDLINYAKSQSRSQNQQFAVGDITKLLPVNKKDFTHCAIVLALQNVENMQSVFANVSKHLQPGGRFLIVLNHPCFRIPRQSSWGVDEQKKTQYRRIDRYLSPIKIPINMNPGHRSGTKLTWSFHNPISVYSEELRKSGFLIEVIEEWQSDKESQGKAARMENRAREEFPMFLAIVAVKQSTAVR